MGEVNFVQLMVLFVSAAVVTLLVAFRAFIKDCDSQCQVQPYHTRYVLVSLTLFSLAAMICLHHQRRRLYGKLQPEVTGLVAQQANSNSVYVHNMAYFLEKYAMDIGVIIFGAGSVVQHTFCFITALQCIPYMTDNGFLPIDNTTIQNTQLISGDIDSTKYGGFRDTLSIMIMHFGLMIFFTWQIPFLCKIRRYQYLRRRQWIHHITVLIASTNIALWVYKFLTESHLVFLYGGHSNTDTYLLSLRNACYAARTVLILFNENILKVMTFPLTMEFALAATEILVHLWLLPYQYQLTSDSADEQTNMIPSSQERTGLLDFHSGYGSSVEFQLESPPVEESVTGSSLEERSIRQDDDCEQDGFMVINSRGGSYIYIPPKQNIHLKSYQSIRLYVTKRLNVYAALLTGLFDVLTFLVYLLHMEITEDSREEYFPPHYFEDAIEIPVTTISNLIACVGILVSLHCVLIQRSFAVKRQGTSRLEATDIIVALAVVSIFCLALFDVITFIQELLTNNSEFEKAFFGSFVTAVPLYFIQYVLQAMVMYMGRRREGNLRHVYYSTLQDNLSFLAMMNVLLWAKASFLVPKFYEKDTQHRTHVSVVLSDLFRPPCIYFRFISVFILLKIKNRLREDDIKYWAFENRRHVC